MSAVTSQGTGISFNGQTLGKVVSVGANFSSATKEIRVMYDQRDAQTGQYLSTYEATTCDSTVEVEGIGSSSGLDSSIVGSKGGLSIAGGNWYVTFPSAICESFKITAKVGDVVRFTCAFKKTFS